jgi:hypothetical protein
MIARVVELAHERAMQMAPTWVLGMPGSQLSGSAAQPMESHQILHPAGARRSPAAFAERSVSEMEPGWEWEPARQPGKPPEL